MLLSEFQEIQEIDQKISELHNKRTHLFNAPRVEKQLTAPMLMGSQNLFSPTATIYNEAHHTRQKYAELVEKWQLQGIKVPAFSKIKSQLEHAFTMFSEIALARPELFNKMTVVLVPPVKEIAYSSSAHRATSRKPLHLASDFLEAKFDKPNTVKNWRVLLVYSEAEGIYVGTPKQLLNEKPYTLAGYDAYALGINEYSAFVMQESSEIDRVTSTVLLKDCAPDARVVPIGQFDTKGYLFGAETVISPFGDIRFRPAIAVK